MTGAGSEVGGSTETGDGGGEAAPDEGSTGEQQTTLAVEAPTPGAYPLALASRPLVIPRGQLTVIAGPHPTMGDLGGFTITHIPSISAGPVSVSIDPLYTFSVGAAYGVIDNLEVGAVAIPLLLSPEFKFGNPTLYGMYRILSGNFELGAAATINLPVQSGTDFGLGVGVPIAYHLSDTMRLNSGAFLNFTFADPMVSVLTIPVGLTVNVADNIFVGARTGIGGNLKAFGDTLAIPLTLQAGYTLANDNNGPLADLIVQFGFPAFLTPGSAGSKSETGLWQLTLGANIHLNP